MRVMERTKFERNKENFVCEHCGLKVVGNGYTNHCPKCLWSKHVDIHPGDRMADCGGMMEPREIESKAGKYVIVHVCLKCKHQKRNKVQEEDDFSEVIRISKERED